MMIISLVLLPEKNEEKNGHWNVDSANASREECVEVKLHFSLQFEFEMHCVCSVHDARVCIRESRRFYSPFFARMCSQ